MTTLAAEDRLAWLDERLAADGHVTISVAAAELAVSDMTIRRDLAELEDRGVARRVRGGARAVGPQAFGARLQAAPRAKARIAAKLVDLLPTSGAVGFDASSTVLRLANDLGTAQDLTVLTNGPDTFTALQGQAGVTPLLTGGELDARTGSLVGPLACRAAAHLALQVFVTSAAAVDPRLGGLEASLDEAEVKRALVDAAERVVLAVDASKLDGRALAVGVEWDRVDLLVTELDPTDERLDPYRDLTSVG